MCVFVCVYVCVHRSNSGWGCNDMIRLYNGLFDVSLHLQCSMNVPYGGYYGKMDTTWYV